MLHVQLPVHCNVSVSVAGEDTHAYLKTANPPEQKLTTSKTWKHPGYSKDPRHVIACMARERKFINRNTVSAVTKDAVDSGLSLVTHMLTLASKFKLTAYRVAPDSIDVEISERGPVVATIPVTTALLNHVSGLMKGESSKFVPSGKVHGHVAVIIVGWEHTDWVVGLPWGNFPKSTWGETAWDGYLRIPRGYEIDACAFAKRSDIVTTPSDGYSFLVKLISPTASPEPPVPVVKAPPPPSNVSHQKRIRNWFTDDHVMMLTEGVVTVTIIIICIITLIMLTKKH